MPNGNDYILFYLALMLQSIETVGHLRFTEFVPYNEEMLSALTDTNIDTVRTALAIFADLGLIRFLEDGTIFLPSVPSLTGKESESTERVRAFRARQKQEKLLSNVTCNNDVTKSNDNKEKEEEKEEEKNKDKDKDKEITTEMLQAKKLAALLLSESRKHDNKLKVGKEKETITSWAIDIEKLIRIDKRDPKDINNVIIWSKTDGNFWVPNILSGKKLRDKFPTLFVQMENEKSKKVGKQANAEISHLQIDKY